MTTMATHDKLTTDKDISSQAFWEKTFIEREETFGWLRRNAPVSWHPALETPEYPDHGQEGFWAVTTNADVSAVSLNHEVFSSAQDPDRTSWRPVNPKMQRAKNFLAMDPPDHTRYRKIMSAGFTPKAVQRLTAKIEERAEQIVSRVVGAGDIDFVHEVSAKLPMLTIADLVGVPESLTETFAIAGDNIVSARDPEVRPEGVSFLDFFMQQLAILREIGVDLVNHRRQHPADDIATVLAEAEFDGRKLDDNEILSMFLLLSVAGNDTTKQTTSSTVISLARNPEQRAWLMEDFDGRIVGSIEEFIRHASPVMQFARTAMQDTEVGGQHIAKGEKVVMFYCSGNRDEKVFDRPEGFDLSRGRTQHVAFGGGGVHYCLGNAVAKAQLKALFSQILTKLPNMTVGEPEYLLSEFIHGVRKLPVNIS
ncbi:putative cytochrome P450 [Microbacterium sp. HM58-2]|nr:putative cytochrome P450 [Microbacterium sp. HM58-2]